MNFICTRDFVKTDAQEAKAELERNGASHHQQASQEN